MNAETLSKVIVAELMWLRLLVITDLASLSNRSCAGGAFADGEPVLKAS